MNQKRNSSIDVVKGFLILCVIIGHVLKGTTEENMIRGVIYSFHMPLFMFMSGWMLNLTKLSSLSFKSIFSKYWDRMLKMWLMAFVVFSLYRAVINPSCTGICRLIYTPWFHLWYVPTLFCYIIIVRFLFEKTNKVTAYLILFLLYVLWRIVQIQISPHFIYPMIMPRWCDFSQIPYFALGVFLKNHLSGEYFQRSYWIAPLLFISAILSTKLMHFQTCDLLQMTLLGLVIIFFLYPSVKNDTLPKSRVLSFIGKNSLYIYLWHMIFVQPLRDYVSNITLYYGLSLFLILAFIVLIEIKTRTTNID